MRHTFHPIDGRKVARLRDLQGYTATSFAAKVGISGAYMRRLESGERNPSPEVRNRIAEHLGVSLADITLDDHQTPVAA